MEAGSFELLAASLRADARDLDAFFEALAGKESGAGRLTQAMYHARELAMTRMEEEADQLGADGVVGVRHEWGGELAEFLAGERTLSSSLRSGRRSSRRKPSMRSTPRYSFST